MLIRLRSLCPVGDPTCMSPSCTGVTRDNIINLQLGCRERLQLCCGRDQPLCFVALPRLEETPSKWYIVVSPGQLSITRRALLIASSKVMVQSCDSTNPRARGCLTITSRGSHTDRLPNRNKTRQDTSMIRELQRGLHRGDRKGGE